MKKSILEFEPYTTTYGSTAYRTVFKTQHGRLVYLSAAIWNDQCEILQCFYVDRNQNRNVNDRCRSVPKKLKTVQFPVSKLLNVTEAELDKKFFGIEYVDNGNSELSLEEYLQQKAKNSIFKYSFLIMIGDGAIQNGLPIHLRTRFKNKLHRSIYAELEYYKNGQGVVKECYYYDRRYSRQGLKVTPYGLVSCFFPYTSEGILNFFNREICCNFTHIIITEGIDISSNTTPLCGSI